MKTKLLSACLMLLLSSPVFAEIERVIVDCEQGVCFNWWPKLPKVKGWQHDPTASMQQGFNAQIPEGFNFDNAPAVIYAQAIYKPEQPEVANLQQLIVAEQQQFKRNVSDAEVKTLDEIKTADGKVLQRFLYRSKAEGSWEQVAYGEEGTFFLVFSVSSSNQRAFDNATKSFALFLSNYKEKL